MTLRLLDCTLRDGGYYNAWDFSSELISDYLHAMESASVDVVEFGFRFLENKGFKGACAFTTDEFLESLSIPTALTVGVMINGADLCTEAGVKGALSRLFPRPAEDSPVTLVRMACHFHELPQAFEAAEILAARGYRIGINLMQISDRSEAEILELSHLAAHAKAQVIYFSDSMGSLVPDDTARIVQLLRQEWDGELGIHTHDNLGLALSNTLRAQQEGVDWLDATVTGMGRGPGNARTEELAIEVADLREEACNLVPLMTLIRKHFAPLQARYGWGTNSYYYLAGKYRIHPTYIQEMLGDDRYDEEDILAVIEHLRAHGGKRFSVDTLDMARNFYTGEPRGRWAPAKIMAGKEVLILGSGPGVAEHRRALETYIHRARPLVLALNTQEAIDPELIDFRIACHPVRMLADIQSHAEQPQPLITPASMLPEDLRTELAGKELLDFGLGVEPGHFAFHDTHCIIPASLVLAYALATAASGRASRILMAGFDGYPPGDARNDELEAILAQFTQTTVGPQPVSVTPTRHKCETISVYGLMESGRAGRGQTP
jgi:4-hydroxy 2-oxovalerate aldolase